MLRKRTLTDTTIEDELEPLESDPEVVTVGAREHHDANSPQGKCIVALQRLWAQRAVCRLLAFNVGSWANGIKIPIIHCINGV
jgi:hypothetical protein